MRDVVVIGSGGQLGQCVKALGEEWTYLDSNALDLRDPGNVEMFFSAEKPKVILNLAAYTAVDKAEEETDLAMAINGNSSGVLAASCDTYFYVSTDYVFDGSAQEAYSEDHPTAPINRYGESKLLGEKAALEANPNTFVIRTSWLYSEYGNNFLKTMLKIGPEKEELKIVNDQMGSPTYAGDLAVALVQMINEIGDHPPGIYHFANSGQCTWFEFAKEIFSLTEIDVLLHGIPTADYPTPAKRPSWSVLNTAKIEKELSISIPSWQDSLQKCLAEL